MRILLLIILISVSTLTICQNLNPCDSISKSILFNSNKYNLSKSSEALLLKVIDEIKQPETYRIVLIGHTDRHGSIQYNQQLSKKRVQSVERYMLDRLDTELSTDYFGETQLLKTDSTTLDDSLNRRVEIKYFINCETDTSHTSKNNSIHKIYKKDPNCHIDTLLTNTHYNLNLINQSKNNVLVIDWTRSMYGYGLTLLKWFEINRKPASFKNIVVFNDGNGKPTARKQMGKTGGIYTQAIDSINKTVALLEKVATNGTGGDYPENYIEALVYAQNTYPSLDTLILIADNRACIRDYKYLDSLHKPVIVILNEIDEKDKIINYQYINLIAQVGGRLVFMNQEIEGFSFKNEHGYKPIYYKDTIIKLPKVRGSLDKANAKIKVMIAKQTLYSTPPILLLNNKELDYCFNKNIPQSTYKIGCAQCKNYDYEIKKHTTIIAKYTLLQKIARKWRKRARVRFGVTAYKWRKIKCNGCMFTSDKTEKKECKKEKRKCSKAKNKCKRNKKKCKRKLRKYRKKQIKSFFKSIKGMFKGLFKRNKGAKGSSDGGGSKPSVPREQ